jgi:vacuolar-type H+-ATPase subunit I/STV1
MSETPETDAAWAVESGNGLNEVKEISRKLERERDEAREVAGELADVASKYVSFLLAVTPSKTNETHEKETMRVIDALKRWKEL